MKDMLMVYVFAGFAVIAWLAVEGILPIAPGRSIIEGTVALFGCIIIACLFLVSREIKKEIREYSRFKM